MTMRRLSITFTIPMTVRANARLPLCPSDHSSTPLLLLFIFIQPPQRNITMIGLSDYYKSLVYSHDIPQLFRTGATSVLFAVLTLYIVNQLNNRSWSLNSKVVLYRYEESRSLTHGSLHPTMKALRVYQSYRQHHAFHAYLLSLEYAHYTIPLQLGSPLPISLRFDNHRW